MSEGGKTGKRLAGPNLKQLKFLVSEDDPRIRHVGLGCARSHRNRRVRT